MMEENMAIVIRTAYQHRERRKQQNPQARDRTPLYKTHLNGRLSFMLFAQWLNALERAYAKDEVLPLPVEYPTFTAVRDMMLTPQFQEMYRKGMNNWDSDPWVINEVKRARTGNRF